MHATAEATGRPWRGVAPRLPRSTPERLWAALFVAIVLLTATTAVAAGFAWSADRQVSDIGTRLGPVSSGSLTVYSDLAAADAVLVNEVLAAPVGAPVESGLFDAKVSDAARNVATAGALSGGDEVSADGLADIAVDLPAYAGLADRARVGAVPGRPVDPDAVNRASDVMQSSILPSAESVASRQADQLDVAYESAARVPVAAVVLGAVSVVALAGFQAYLWRRTRRVFTPGMVLATVAVVAAGVWWTVAGVSCAEHLDASRRHLELVTDALGPAQVAAAQARAAEGLALVNGDRTGDAGFADRIRVLARDGGRGGALGAARALAGDGTAAGNVESAATAVRDYVAAHDRVRAFLAAGRTDQAARSVVISEPGSSAEAFTTLDTQLTASVRRETDTFREEIAAAEALRAGLVVSLLVLGGVAVAGACWGCARRLGEYR